jgi:hypothetical protein
VACREGRAGPPRGGKTEKQPGDIINSLDSAAPSKRQQAYARKENTINQRSTELFRSRQEEQRKSARYQEIYV